jgi:hypothetical protein
MFGNFRADRGRDRYPEITYHRAPHKPFMLLSVMDFIAQGRICENLIESSYGLVAAHWAARPKLTEYFVQNVHY